MRREFPSAPWSRSLRLISSLGALALLALAVAAYHAAPGGDTFTHRFGVGVALVPVVVVLASICFVVRGYAVEGNDLHVRRLLYSSRISLIGLASARAEPGLCKDSIRVVGNGGLFSFSGTFYSKHLGRYRLLATDLSRAVVLVLPRQVVVVSPADPRALIEHLRWRFPNVEATLPAHAA